MVGELNEAYLSELREEDADEDQQSLFDFSDDSQHTATTIAVVSKPNDTGILEHTDEYMPHLGMPRSVLDDFQKLRAQMNEMSATQEHNKAYEKLDLDRQYREHLRSHQGAQLAMKEIVNRLRDGEDITLVCFEKEPKKCHRHILMEFIENEL